MNEATASLKEHAEQRIRALCFSFQVPASFTAERDQWLATVRDAVSEETSGVDLSSFLSGMASIWIYLDETLSHLAHENDIDSMLPIVSVYAPITDALLAVINAGAELL